MDKGFLKAISGPFLCFIFAALYNAFHGWESGECAVVVDFSYANTIGRWSCGEEASPGYLRSVDVYKRLYDQWQFNPTLIQQMLLKVMQQEIVEKGQCRGKKVKFEPNKAYPGDADEKEELAKDLAGDLESAGLESWASGNEEDEARTTEEDIWVSPQPTRVGQEEDGDSDEDKENEEASKPEENKEVDQECAQ